MRRLDARDYGFWFVRVIDRIGLGWFTGAVIVGLIPYLMGLAAVAPFGYAGLYLRTPAFYIGFVGVTLVMAASVRGVEILADGLSDLGQVCDKPRAFHSYVHGQLTAAARARSNGAFLFISFMGAGAVVASALHRWHQSGLTPHKNQFNAFLVDWHSSHALLPVGIALAIFAIAVATTFGSSATLLARNLSFSWRLRNFEYMPFPGRVRLGVRRLVTAYSWVSATWMIGVALFALFFFRHWTTLNVVGIATLTVLGILTLALPYNTFRKILDDSHEAMAETLSREIEPRNGQSAPARDFATVNMAITADPPPVLTRRGAMAYGLVQIVALATIFAKDVLQEQVSFFAK